MPIVFDEVIGSVEPEQPPAAEQPPAEQQRQQQSDLAAVRSAIRRIEQRAERLKAD